MNKSFLFTRIFYFTVFILALGCGSGSDPATPTFSITGSVTGLDGTLVLQNNGNDDLEVTINGDISIAAEVPEGTEYDITVEEQPEAQTCTIENGSGTIDDDVSDIEITCVDDPALSYSSLVFSEEASNDGLLSSITITLEGDTFDNVATWTEGVEYTLTGTAFPAGVTLVVTASDSTTLSLGFIGYAEEHRTVDNLNGITFTISPTAFTSGEAAIQSSVDFEIDYLNATTVVAYGAGLHNGNLGGRVGADLLCAGAKPGNVYQNNTRAFIGVDEFDEIQDFAILSGLSTDLTVVSSNGTQLGNDWADFVDNSIDATLVAAGVTSNGTSHWSGSFANGSITPIDNCVGWTSSFGGMTDTGSTGSSNASGSFLFDNISVDCDLSRHLICIAYD